MTTGIIIQARTGSSRLPNKAFLPIGDRASLAWCIGQCKKMEGIDKIILATTRREEDKKLKRFCYGDNMHFYQGRRDDLIARHYGAAQRYGIDTIVRVTGDSPVFCPEMGEYLLKNHLENKADYTEALEIVPGTSCQIWSYNAFEKLTEMNIGQQYTEHMSFFVLQNPDKFKIVKVKFIPSCFRKYRLTLDYPEDLEMFNALFKTMEGTGIDMNQFCLQNIYDCLEKHPEISSINQHLTNAYDSKEMQQALRLENDRINLAYF